jgi:hypothetical protein
MTQDVARSAVTAAFLPRRGNRPSLGVPAIVTRRGQAIGYTETLHNIPLKQEFACPTRSR